jgi:hypothetical protein
MRSLGMSTLKIFLISAALRIAPQSTFSGSMPVTIGAAETAVVDGEGLGDGSALGAADSPLAGASLASAAGEPSAEPSPPLDTVTTAVTVRRAPEVSDPHPETINTPAIAAASTR